MIDQNNEAKFDDLLRRVISDAAADEALLNDIADSPSLRWSIQRGIANGSRSPWPPPRKLLQWLMLSVPAAAVLLIVAGAFFIAVDSSPEGVSVAQGEPVTDRSPVDTVVPQPETSTPGAAQRIDPPASSVRTADRKDRPHVPSRQRTGIVAKAAGEAKTSQPAKTTRSEFIALSYVPKPESGQIIKVKVPSSMMVTLGLVASVEKPSALVNAEVIIGDDGVSHSIRFIR
jgi:hypothetical protein